MGVKVKHWKGAYWVFINHRGRRKAKRVGEGENAKRAAQRAAEIIQGKLAAGDVSALDESCGRVRTLTDFAEEWLTTAVLLHCKPATQENYRVALRRHWLPVLGSLSLGAVTRERIRAVMAEKLSKAELKPSSLRSALIPLSACLHAALEAGLIPGNPAIRLGRFLRRPDDAEVQTIDPFTPAELTTLLTTAEQQMPESYPLILTLARTGLRIGEALALKREDLDFHQGTVWVRRTWGRRTIGTTKTGKARRVDMSQQLRRVLQAHLTLREAEAVVAGRLDSPWLVPDPEHPAGSTPLTPLAFYKAVWWALVRRSGVRYRKPHTLRHTFASLLLQNGESVTYVRDQLGHSSIRMTVDTYGHLVPGANRGAVDRLDDATGRNLYATSASDGEARSEEPRGVRARPEYFPTRDWDVVAGRTITQNEVDAASKVAVIGQTAARNLFGDAHPIGFRIRIAKVPFTVIGVLDRKGQTTSGYDQDDQVLISLSTAKRKVLGSKTTEAGSDRSGGYWPGSNSALVLQALNHDWVRFRTAAGDDANTHQPQLGSTPAGAGLRVRDSLQVDRSPGRIAQALSPMS